MKLIILLLVLAISAPAQTVYLADREDAVEAFHSESALALTKHREGADVRGKVALVIDGHISAAKLRDALILALGVVFETFNADCSVQTFRGHECTTTAR